MIDPFKPEEITEAMIKVMNNNHLREELISKGTEQSAKFSWLAMAREVLKIYQEINPNKK
ncbi:hypothetical protein JZU69_04565 [bacterium]|nr:hypothetical protein [bacterium]